VPTSEAAKNILVGLFFAGLVFDKAAADAVGVILVAYLPKEDFAPRDGFVLELTWFLEILLLASLSIMWKLCWFSFPGRFLTSALVLFTGPIEGLRMPSPDRALVSSFSTEVPLDSFYIFLLDFLCPLLDN